MANVVITIPVSRFEHYEITPPADWDFAYVSEPFTDEELIREAKDAAYLFVGSAHTIPKAVIDACPNLKMIQTEGVAFDKVDCQAAKERNIPVCNNKGVNAAAVAEHTVGLILAGFRRIALSDRQYRKEGFAPAKAAHLAQGEHELTDKVIGFVGMGDIGKEAVKRLNGWGCRFAYYDVFRMKPEMEEEYNITYMEFDELVKTCDVISMHVPVVPATINMLGKEQFQAMKKTALVINTARGEVIDQDALIWALENDEIYGAALDVLLPEPLPADAPILHMSQKAMDKLTITPHVGGMTDEAFTRMLIQGMENIQRVMNGEEPVNIMNNR